MFEHDEGGAAGRDVLAGVRPDRSGTPQQQIAWVLTQRPSAATLAVLEAMISVPLPRAWRVLEAKCWDRQQSAVAALASAAKVSAATVTPGSGTFPEAAESELALMLRRTDAAMRYELTRDRRLTELPHLFGVLARGDCTQGHTRKFIEITEDLDADVAAAVDAEVGERAASTTAAAFSRAVRKSVATHDKRSPAEKQNSQRPKLGVRCYPRRDGLISISATMPATEGVAAMVEINRRADALRVPNDQRTHGERQLDALFAGLDTLPVPVDTSTGELPGDGDQPAGRRRSGWLRAEVQVVIDWRSLLGLSDQPGELRGFGPIDAAEVRALLAQPGTTLRRLVTDPITGVLIDYGKTRYRPDAHLAGLLSARDGTCRWPGCTRNARYCDDEHAVPYPEGDTSAANLTKVCPGHHTRKTFDGFSYNRPDPSTGETVWTTPLGFRYRQTPTTYTECGPDPGDTMWLDEIREAEIDQRFVPPLPQPVPPPSPPPQSDPPF
jgi:hypothetical protein